MKRTISEAVEDRIALTAILLTQMAGAPVLLPQAILGGLWLSQIMRRFNLIAPLRVVGLERITWKADQYQKYQEARRKALRDRATGSKFWFIRWFRRAEDINTEIACKMLFVIAAWPYPQTMTPQFALTLAAVHLFISAARITSAPIAAQPEKQQPPGAVS
jgi:hypothetical protein